MIPTPKTKSDLENLIQGSIEENINLEYKGADSLQNTELKKKEIAKDISSMANAAGGLIIYGIKEFDEPNKKHLPEKITPNNRTQFSREWLEQVILSNISPRIEGLIISPIQLDTSTEVVYVIEIPQGTTAHQCTADFRYYRRHNFVAEPMLDYEIRDIMNRAKYPLINLYFSIEKKTMKVSETPFSSLIGRSIPTTQGKREYFTKLSLKITPLNEGPILAKYVNYFVEIPEEVIDSFVAKDMTRSAEGYVEFYAENTIRDVVDYKADYLGGTTKYGPSRFDPILPGLSGRSKELVMIDNPSLDERELSWRVYADNAPPNSGKTKLNEIGIIETSENDI